MELNSINIVRNYSNYLALLIISLFLGGCANRIPPEGGPVDPTTPEIISTYPDSNALNFQDKYIKIEFDRYVDELTFKESIFISPSVGDLEFDWSGSEVLINFSGQLQSNKTYVVNIGTDVADRFINQKKMAKAYTLAFSTGPDLDRGGIEGQVFSMKEGDPIAGIMIFAYQLDGINPDTLNPQTSKPDYITQTGKSGDFFLHHIPFGSYRIFAIRDEYRNLIYDPETDEYAVPPSLIRITSNDTLATGVLMKLAKEDTTSPRLIKISAPERNHVFVEFSEPLDTASVTLSSFIINDTLNQEPLKLITSYPISSANSVVVITQNQDSTKAYRINIQNVKDSVGNIISSLANSLVFNGSSKADTLGPRLAYVSFKDSVQNIVLQPVMTLTFSDALAKTVLVDWINILDNNKHVLPSKKKWISDVTISVCPEQELMSKTWYSLRAELRSLSDWSGRVSRDSTKEWRFETIDFEDLSSIEGIVLDTNKTDNIGRIYVTATQVGAKTINRYTTAADASGKFIFPQVVEGQYILQAFRDRSENGIYDYGKPFPFTYSERMSPISDIYKVRARWPLEGVIIKMK